MVNLLADLRDEFGLACLLVAHDLSIVRQVSDRIAVMYLGRIVEIGPVEDVSARPTHPYTEALVSAVPIPDPDVAVRRERIVLRGDVPSAVSPPAGCRFHPRCRHATDVCRTEDPPLLPTRRLIISPPVITRATSRRADAMLPRRVRCAVIGMGALGSAAAYRLAQRLGDGVLVLEQFQPGHTRGASEDHSRLIRHSYASTIYTRLTPAMFTAWRDVEVESGASLITTAGGLDVGDPAVPGSVEAIENNAAALRDQNIGFELVDADTLRRRWPQWHVADDVRAVYQPDGGSLDIGRACAAHLRLARRCGAQLYPGTRVLGVLTASDNGSVRLHTDAGAVEADDLVVCAGKWTNRVLGELGQLPLTYTREQVTYFVAPSLADFAPERFPIWIRPGEPCFYGLGTHGLAAIKVAEDLGGLRWKSTTRRVRSPRRASGGWPASSPSIYRRRSVRWPSAAPACTS